MTLDQIHLYIPLSVLALVTFSSWAVITVAKRKRVLFTLIPLLVALGYSSFFAVDTLMGYPTATVTINKELYIAHHVNSDKTMIHVWTNTKRDIPRAYRIPYSKESEEKLSEAKEQKDSGVPVVLGTESNRKDGGTEWAAQTIRLYRVELAKQYQK